MSSSYLLSLISFLDSTGLQEAQREAEAACFTACVCDRCFYGDQNQGLSEHGVPRTGSRLGLPALRCILVRWRSDPGLPRKASASAMTAGTSQSELPPVLVRHRHGAVWIIWPQQAWIDAYPPTREALCRRLIHIPDRNWVRSWRGDLLGSLTSEESRVPLVFTCPIGLSLCKPSLLSPMVV
ncbi:unnamed protein product [Gadus morhua 'NCC']